MSEKITIQALQDRLNAMLKFPDQNPNPVMKMDMDGRLLYANNGSRSILHTWKIWLGDKMPDALIAHAGTPSDEQLQLPVGTKTYAFHVVAVPEIESINIYATDVTAMKAITKFPDQNPNPVLKSDMDGRLLYVNSGGEIIKRSWGVDIGSKLPAKLVAHAGTPANEQLEMAVGSLTYSFHVVAVPEFEFINIYGTDVTAMKAITKFPDQNPNPVLKSDMDGRLLYVNSGGEIIKQKWNVDIGSMLPPELVAHAGTPADLQLEMSVGSRVYSFHVVAVPEFKFINIYGTDITAAKDNELILIKLAKYFSPQVYDSIFSGDLEVKIQTKRKRLTVFFSDIKGFSEITERLEPEVLTEMLTEYLTLMTNIAVKHGGTVDKYIGDAIMVFFGDPHSNGVKADALACVRMAVEMKACLRDIRKTWRDKGVSQPLDIRVGIHTDTCTVGNFGSMDRLDYTTIGNGVNLASRLESNARANQILISEDTYLLIGDEIDCDKLDKIKVKNIKHPIQTYEVRGEKQDRLQHVFEVQSSGFSLSIDPSQIEGVEEKKKALEKALTFLNHME